MQLLDTDIVVDLLRCHQPALDWLESLGDEALLVPGFVVMEVLQGCRNKAELRAAREALEDYEVVWPSELACRRALSVFAECYLKDGLGIIDALIGQVAVEFGIRLATFNQKHYASVPDLQTIQPYAR